MNRTVCGICWTLYDDEGRCECPQVQEPPRRTGLPHCERSCEANAFQIEIRRLKAALEQEPWVKTYCGGKPNYTTPAEPRRRLTDSEIAVIWFHARLPGVTETAARMLIRAAEGKLRDIA